MPKKRFFLYALLICSLTILVIAFLLIQHVMWLSSIQPAGTGIPAFTSQFGGIKTRVRTPTLGAFGQRIESSAGKGIMSVGYREEPQHDLPGQALYPSCTADRRVTATPTASGPVVVPTPQPTPVPTDAAAASISTEPDFIVLHIVGRESEACYQVGEVFFEQNNRYVVAVGVTKAINGEIAIDRANLANSQIGAVVIDISQFRSDERSRDGAIREDWLESNKYPLAKLVSSRIVGLPARPYIEGEVLSFQVISVLEIRNVQKEVVFHATAALSGATLISTAYADIKMSDFGARPPNMAGALRANDEMRIVLNIVAREPQAAAATATLTPSGTSTLQPTPCPPTTRGNTRTEPIDDAPERDSVGKGHVLRGTVRSSAGCVPISNAAIIFWLAGPDGKYDDAHRAKVYTDRNGAYRFESNFPGQYENATPHIHLYITAPGYRAIETEYLPRAGATEGTFNIVLAPLPSTATVTVTATPTR